MGSTNNFSSYRDQEPSTSASTTGAPTTRETRSQLTALTDSQADPAIKVGFETKREFIRLDMFEDRIKHASLFEQLYCESQESYLAAMSLFNIAKAHLRPENRWMTMPLTPKNENEVQTAFMEISGTLERYWNLQLEREQKELPRCEILNTSQKSLRTRDGGFLKPDVFFEGSGSLFPTLPPRKSNDPPPWSLCIAPGDLKTTKDKDTKKHFGQLGTYVEQVLAAQENRRFVPTFRLDESKLYFFTFDRGGAVSGPAIDYHTDATKLCVLVQTLLLSFKDCDLGFDPSISYEDGNKYISTDDEIEGDSTSRTIYIVDRTLFHSTNIRGNGSIYWLVCKKGDDDQDTRYLIKDSWTIGGCGRERELLEECKDIMGVASVVHIQDVWIRGKLDSVSNNRPRGVITPPADNRVHTRVVLRASVGAKLLDQFSSTLELLGAMRDAVLGHRELYASGVLHGDISPTHIVIQPNAVEGNRGILIDLQHSIRTKPYSSRPSEPSGSCLYRSRNALSGNPLAYSHLDDLESFYYVLCHMVTCYPASGSTKPKQAPLPISLWFSTHGGRGAKAQNLMEDTCPYPIDPSFEPEVKELVESMRGFFKDQWKSTFWSAERKTQTPEEDYDEFLKHIDLAIDALAPKSETLPLNTDRGPDAGMQDALLYVATENTSEVRDTTSMAHPKAPTFGENRPDNVANSGFNPVPFHLIEARDTNEGPFRFGAETDAQGSMIVRGNLEPLHDTVDPTSAAIVGTYEEWAFQEPENSFSGLIASGTDNLPERSQALLGAFPYGGFGLGLVQDGSHLEYLHSGPGLVPNWDVNYLPALESSPSAEGVSQHDPPACPLQPEYVEYPGYSHLPNGDEQDLILKSRHFVNDSFQDDQVFPVQDTGDSGSAMLYSRAGTYSRSRKREERPDSSPAPPSKRNRLDT